MTLDLLHAEAVTDTETAGLVTTGGTGSILHAVLSYREWGRNERSIRTPNIIKPETGHPAFDKACHLFDVELRRAPVDPKSTLVDVDWVADNIDENTVALIGSACNYGYGTVDPIDELSRLALDRGVGLHVDGCLGGFILPFGRSSATTSPSSTSGCRASPACRPTPTSTATRSRAARWCRSAPRSCATRSTSS